MSLLRLITWPYVRKHRLRALLTTAGIVLGVGLLVSMRAANRSVMAAFEETVDRIAGKTQLQIESGDSGFPEEVLERVQALPEVRAAAPVIEATVDTGLPAQGRLLILAVDMTGDRSLRDYAFESGDEDVIDDPLVFLAQPDSLIVTRDFAARNQLATGSKLMLDTMEGRKQFTVRGILKPGGMAQAYGGNLGIMDIYAAQKVFGRGLRFDRIDIGVAEGVAVPDAQARLQRALGPAFTVEAPAGRGRQFEDLLSVYSLSVSISSAFALFIGMFIIYNAFSIAVLERRREIGILRCLGATRQQVRMQFLLESAVAGGIGSAAGIAGGLLAARGLANLTAGTMEGVYGVIQHPETTVIEPWFLALAMLMGILTSMVAAWVPARRAASVEPVQALQKGRYQVLSAGDSRNRRRIAAAAAVLALACLPLGSNSRIFYTGYMAVVIAALLFSPALALSLARLLRTPMGWIRPVEGALAADSLIQAPRRTSATVTALMLSLALVVGQAGVARASFTSIHTWLDTTLNPDLFVSTSESLSAREYHFPIAMRSELESIPGVEEVQPVRTVRTQYRGTPVMLVAVDLERVAKRVRRNTVAGDPAEMNRLAKEEKGLIVSDNMAELHHLKIGDVVEMPAPLGGIRLPVVGIIRDFSNQTGAIFLDRGVYVRHWGDSGVDIFRVYLARGASQPAVREQINRRFAGQSHFFVLLNQDVRQYVDRTAQQWFAMTYLQLVVAVLVAVLGIANTITVSITDRKRELGILRAVGGLRTQIRHTLWLEAGAIGTIGLILGIGVGAVQLYYLLEVVRRDFTGMALSYQFPSGVVMAMIPVMLGAAVLSAVLPAEKAVRSSLVEALEYE